MSMDVGRNGKARSAKLCCRKVSEKAGHLAQRSRVRSEPLPLLLAVF